MTPPQVDPKAAASQIVQRPPRARMSGEAGVSTIPVLLGTAAVSGLGAYLLRAFGPRGGNPSFSASTKVAVMTASAVMGGMLGAALDSAPPSKPPTRTINRGFTDQWETARNTVAISCAPPGTSAAHLEIASNRPGHVATMPLPDGVACGSEVILGEMHMTKRGQPLTDRNCVTVTMNEVLVGRYVSGSTKVPTVRHIVDTDRGCHGTRYRNTTVDLPSDGLGR